MRREVLVALFLAALTLGVYWSAVTHEFINYDDPVYVTENPRVQAGLTSAGIVWAFSGITNEQRTYWHPLTWLSHMVDCQLFGLRAGAHHAVNVVLHTVNTLLLFLLFRRMTGALWRSAVLAALFALHPLQVDTVAWVAERKNLLSTLLWLLTLLAYVRYVRRLGAASYAVVCGLFACGLMAKPMLVTLPCVLLLLDFWPLRRVRFASGTEDKPVLPEPAATASVLRLLAEKLPLLALSALSAAITIGAHRRLGLMATVDQLPLDSRLLISLISYACYLGKSIWPTGLAVYYPLVPTWPWWQPALAGLLLLLLSLLAFKTALRRPYLLVGWLWFLGTLVPVIGLLQVSDQARADRWIYVPLIGLLIMVVWGAADFFSTGRRRPVAFTICALVVAACAVTTHIQLRYWQTSETLFRHALVVTRQNYLAHLNLGAALALKHELGEAETQLGEALRLKPNSALAHYDLGNVLGLKGNLEGAADEYAKALELQPKYAQAHFNMGNVLALQRRFDEAKAHFLEALRLDPDYADAHIHLANLLVIQGRAEEAIPHCLAGLATKPNAAEAYYCLGNAQVLRSKPDLAKTYYLTALRLKPDYAEAHSKFGELLLLEGRPAEAMPHLGAAADLQPDNEEFQYALGGALARDKHFAEAAARFRAAIRARPDYATALNDLAWLLATHPDPKIRNVPEGVELARRACQVTDFRNPSYLDTLAVAQSEAGEFSEAIKLTEKAVEVAKGVGNSGLAEQLQSHLAAYRAGRNYTAGLKAAATAPSK
jgi:protein O-mannosyl-transferase